MGSCRLIWSATGDMEQFSRTVGLEDEVEDDAGCIGTGGSAIIQRMRSFLLVRVAISLAV
jgi:hypothetical protein